MAYHASTEQTFRTGRSKYFLGGLTSRTGKIHHVQWVNPLFLLGHGFNVANCCGSTRLHPQLGPGWCLHGHKPLMYICILSGWWCHNHLEKWWSESQWEWWHPIYEMENNPNVWNHQPVIYIYMHNHSEDRIWNILEYYQKNPKDTKLSKFGISLKFHFFSTCLRMIIVLHMRGVSWRAGGFNSAFLSSPAWIRHTGVADDLRRDVYGLSSPGKITGFTGNSNLYIPGNTWNGWNEIPGKNYAYYA